VTARREWPERPAIYEVEQSGPGERALDVGRRDSLILMVLADTLIRAGDDEFQPSIGCMSITRSYSSSVAAAELARAHFLPPQLARAHFLSRGERNCAPPRSARTRGRPAAPRRGRRGRGRLAPGCHRSHSAPSAGTAPDGTAAREGRARSLTPAAAPASDSAAETPIAGPKPALNEAGVA
jgi:hypothetical protein